MNYKLIIIGAGAAGLYAGASLPSFTDGLILEQNEKPGKKLLLTGAGQCNLTHGGSIKNFISHYGPSGAKLRSVLYHWNNQSVIQHFAKLGIPTVEREDGKVFPASLRAQDIVDALAQGCSSNGLAFEFSRKVTGIEKISTGCQNPQNTASFPGWRIIAEDGKTGREYIYDTAALIVTTGGCTYPTTGSDGNLFPSVRKLLPVIPPRQALVPIHVQDYPYTSLSGIAFPAASVTLFPDRGTPIKNSDGLLLTHTCFSGPAILNLSRYAEGHCRISINYLSSLDPKLTAASIPSLYKELQRSAAGSKKQLLTILEERFLLPRRFLELLCQRLSVDPAQKASAVPGRKLEQLISLLADDRYTVSGLGGYHLAMVTRGGIALDAVDLKRMEAKDHPGLYFAGEILDVDGDTGGYNLQFAFSSAHLAAHSVSS